MSGHVSDLRAQGCKHQQLWADTTQWPHGSTDNLRKQMTYLQHSGGVFKKQGSGDDLDCGTGLCTHFTESQKLIGQWRTIWDQEVGRDTQDLASHLGVSGEFLFLNCPLLIFEMKTLQLFYCLTLNSVLATSAGCLTCETLCDSNIPQSVLLIYLTCTDSTYFNVLMNFHFKSCGYLGVPQG